MAKITAIQSSNDQSNNQIETKSPAVPITSNYVKSTLDPCVVLMKEIIAKHEHLWTKEKIYSLAQGVVYWNPPSQAYEAVSKSLLNSPEENQFHQYCPDEGIPSLRDAIKIKLKNENNLPSSPDTNIDVIVTAGANQAYMNCVLTLLSPGESCVVFQPYYFNHVMAIQMTRGDDAVCVGPIDEYGIPCVKWLQERLEAQNQDSSSSSTSSQQKITMVTVVNPGNPTGVSIPKSKLERIVKLCKKYGVWLIMDNTYEHFDHISANDLDSDMGNKGGFYCFDDEHVLNIFSFSKGYAMAGFRVGYVAMNTSSEMGQDVYNQMIKVQDTIPICGSRMSQVAALGAMLAVDRQWVTDKVNTLKTGRDAILRALEPLDSIIGGTGAMYLMAKLPDGMDDVEVADNLVEKNGVAVIPGSFCGFQGWIRVCYANLEPDECILAADRLSKGIERISSQ